MLVPSNESMLSRQNATRFLNDCLTGAVSTSVNDKMFNSINEVGHLLHVTHVHVFCFFSSFNSVSSELSTCVPRSLCCRVLGL